MKTLEDIIPPSRRASSGDEPAQPRSRRGFPFMYVLVVLVIIGACIGALIYFSGAEIDAIPSTASAPVTGSYTATAGSTGELPFLVVSTQKVASKTVASSGTRAVSGSASGSITITNTQKVSQKLIANTRFQTTSGLVFKIHTAVTVPAAKGGTPGTVVAKVYADQTGSQYNVGPSGFTLPGLANSPQFKEVTAKSTGSMTGGSSGNEPIISADLESSTRTALMTGLAPDLEAAIKAQIPQGYVLLAGAGTTTYSVLPSVTAATAGQAEIKEQGTYTAVVFPNGALAKALAQTALAGNYHGEEITLANPAALSLSPKDGLPTADSQTFSFSISGTADLSWVINPDRLAAAVAGKSRSEAEDALRNYPEVKGGTKLILKPFWKSHFPEDPSMITVVVQAP